MAIPNESLRMMVQGITADKAARFYPSKWRDEYEEHYSAGNRRELLSRIKRMRTERKMLNEHIRSAKKESAGDPLLFIAGIRDVYVKHSWRNTVWKDSIPRRLYGVDSIVWKPNWQHPVWSDQYWWQNSKWSKIHQLHQSEDNPAMVAYNRNIDNIKRDIQTRTKPGKYLTQFFSDVLTQDEIREWAEKQVAFASCHGELKFIENNDPDGWVDVYERGPRSCMQGNESVKVYAHEGNGLRLAYIESGDDIFARAIVREDEDEDIKGYVRIYSTEQRWATKLQESLAALGYDRVTNLTGVTLQKIRTTYEWREGYVCPYIDTGNYGTQRISIMEKCLLVDEDGEVSATNTSGFIPEYDGEECDSCGELVDEEDMNNVEDGDRRVCQCCLDNHYTYAYGSRYQEYYPNDEVVECQSNGEWYLIEHASNHDVYECRVREEYYHSDDMVLCDRGAYEGDYIHVDEAVRLANDEWAYIGDCSEVDGEWYLTEDTSECVITGDTLVIDKAVEICIGRYRVTHRAHYGTYHTEHMNIVYVGPDAWTADLIRENFLRCGDILVPRGHYGNEINDVTEPTNVSYGRDFEGERYESLFVEEAEELLAA